LKVSFEHLNLLDIPELITIERASQGAPWSEKAFENELVNPHSIFRVARQGGKIVAYGGAWAIVDESHITTVCVHPDHRRKGLGKQMMLDILRESVERGLRCSTLEVRVSNESAIALYHHLGYQSVSVRRKYYPDNGEDALIMWLYGFKDLRP
jgi:ribosomal-protein-alanine N-acetyltransferase